MTARKRNARSYRVFRLESWEAFLQLITKPPYSNWAFRGERDERWPLYSSLSRYLQNFAVSRDAWPEQEGRILRIFKRKAHQFLDKPPDADDDFQWMALMQHHGAPTRLIDFTWSPYVAAFFALERTLADGVVWAMNPARIDSSRAPRPTRTDPRAKGNFDRYFLKGSHRFIWMGEPHTMNRRLIAQSGTFAVPGVLDVPIEEMLKDADQENILAKIVLKNAVREVGMRELYRMNITYATLFPDLDGLAKSMGYELEFHWAYNPRTMDRYHTGGGAIQTRISGEHAGDFLVLLLDPGDHRIGRGHLVGQAGLELSHLILFSGDLVADVLNLGLHSRLGVLEQAGTGVFQIVERRGDGLQESARVGRAEEPGHGRGIADVGCHQGPLVVGESSVVVEVQRQVRQAADLSGGRG